MSDLPSSVPADLWKFLGKFTNARIALGRAGSSVPTHGLLEFQLAHARARDAVHRDLALDTLRDTLAVSGWETLALTSAAKDRQTFIQRPDLGRILDDSSKRLLETRPAAREPFDVVFIVSDGLSALAVERHAAPLLEDMVARLKDADWRLAPLVLVSQGRVAVGDEIGALLSARIAVMLIGERPGLSAADSLGVYLTYDPTPGRTNAQRNCISNIRPEGLGYAAAAHKLYFLLSEARRRKLSGVDLKENAPAMPERDQNSLISD
jgi:ethanolamine ammonia-lyase small subunit